MAKGNEKGLLNHRYTVLNAAYHQVRHRDDLNKNVKLQLEELLNGGEKTLEAVNQTELLLTSLLTGDDLDVAFSKKLFDAEKLELETVSYFKTQFASAKTNKTKQIILKQLLQDLQTEDIKMSLRHTYSSNAWYLASYAFMFTFILFFLPYFFPPILNFLHDLGEGNGRAIDIFTAVTSGAIGAAFSMLIGLKGRISESSLSGLQLLQRKSYVISKIITGFGAGLIFFYFLQSGLLGGVAFPEYSNDAHSLPKNANFDMKSMALLVIWCFLSGFSEKLVPTVLSKTKSQIKQSLSKDDDLK